MLMMRPQRAFIMPRITARDRRNTLRRLVAITSSKSSSFMRSARLSRVMPALFTRMATSPSSLMSASHCAALRTSSTRPFIFLAPSSLVDVPTTLAPALRSSSAIASPMPREAPVTRASLPVSISRLAFERLFERCAIGGGERLHAGRDALGHARQHLARATFDDVRHAAVDHLADGLHPAHRRRGLAKQRVLDAAGVALHGDVDVVDDL